MDYEFRTLDLNYEQLSDYCIKLRKKIVEVDNEDQEGEGMTFPLPSTCSCGQKEITNLQSEHTRERN